MTGRKGGQVVKETKAQDEKKGSESTVFKTDPNKIILSFLSWRELSGVSRVSKTFQQHADIVKKQIEKNSDAGLRKFLEIDPKDPVYAINDLKQLLSCPTVVSALQKVFSKYIQNPTEPKLKDKGMLAIMYLSYSPLHSAISVCINQCIYNNYNKEMLDLAEKILDQSTNSIVIIKAIRACIYIGATKDTLALAKKLIKRLSPSEIKLLNEIPEDQTETVLTLCIKRNYVPFVAMLLEQKEIDPNAVNKNNPPQLPFWVAIQLGYENKKFEIFNLFLRCDRQDLDLQKKINDKNALQLCMESYNELVASQPSIRLRGLNRKCLQKIDDLEKIMNKLIIDRRFESIPKLERKKFLGIFQPLTEAEKFINECLETKKNKKKGNKKSHSW